MHRSLSWMRFSSSDDYYKNSSPADISSLRSSSEENLLPVYDPMIEMHQKEKSNTKFAENAVHVIPLVLFLCGFILWLFSTPVDIGATLNRGKLETAASRVEGLTIDGNIDTSIDGTQLLLPLLDSQVDDVDSINQRRDLFEDSKALAESNTTTVAAAAESLV